MALRDNVSEWPANKAILNSQSGEGVSTTIHLPPGTHHFKFIVDGDMTTNNDLPTAVDFSNVLVNYIEVSQMMFLNHEEKAIEARSRFRRLCILLWS